MSTQRARFCKKLGACERTQCENHWVIGVEREAMILIRIFFGALGKFTLEFSEINGRILRLIFAKRFTWLCVEVCADHHSCCGRGSVHFVLDT